jgi:hypothetical protein
MTKSTVSRTTTSDDKYSSSTTTEANKHGDSHQTHWLTVSVGSIGRAGCDHLDCQIKAIYYYSRLFFKTRRLTYDCSVLHRTKGYWTNLRSGGGPGLRCAEQPRHEGHWRSGGCCDPRPWTHRARNADGFQSSSERARALRVAGGALACGADW